MHVADLTKAVAQHLIEIFKINIEYKYKCKKGIEILTKRVNSDFVLRLVLRVSCCSKFVYGPYVHGSPKPDLSTLFATF